MKFTDQIVSLALICVGFLLPEHVLSQSGGWPTTTAASSGWGSSTGASCTGVSPTLGSGQTWVPNPGCTSGGTYNTADNKRCRCWSHCGYICGPPPTTTTAGSGGWGTPTAAPTTQGWATPTKAPTTQGWATPTKPPTTQGWSTAKPTPTTTKGWSTAKPTATTGGWGSSAAPPTTQGWGSSSGSSASCTNVRPILGSGETWVPNAGCTNGPTYNSGGQHCHCWSHCGYICGSKTTSAPSGGWPPA